MARSNYTTADHVGITLPAAVEQWRGILARRPVAQGRQENFTPVETLLCLAAMYQIGRAHV